VVESHAILEELTADFPWYHQLHGFWKKPEIEMFSRAGMSIIHLSQTKVSVLLRRLCSVGFAPGELERHILVQEISCYRVLCIGFEVAHQGCILPASLANDRLEWCVIVFPP
jgi:hypothetical protein